MTLQKTVVSNKPDAQKLEKLNKRPAQISRAYGFYLVIDEQIEQIIETSRRMRNVSGAHYTDIVIKVGDELREFTLDEFKKTLGF